MADIRIELNVTDAVATVDSDSLDDQTAKIVTALDLLGQTDMMSGTHYAKTAYFPAGTYYISANIVNRALASMTLSGVTDITLRGDGPGATILKIYNSVDYGDA